MRILMMPHKDYHAETMFQIGRELDELGIASSFLRPVEKYSNMGVNEVASKYNIELQNTEELLTGKINPDAVLVMNDWDAASRYLLKYCHDNYIPIIGLQEGICDFKRENWKNKSYNDPSRLPYSYCDCLMLCSEFDATYFPDTPYSIVGMERVEALYSYDVNFPEKPVVLINLNFSFNVCTEFSRQWLLDVTKACTECGFEYIISRHPQDETDVSGFEDQISGKMLHELLAETTVFVSRFSNAIYESLIMGKPVVYYNFHQEKSRNFNETMGAFSAVYRPQDLIHALNYEAGQRRIRTRARQYLDSHVAYDPHISSARRSAQNIYEFMHQRQAQETAFLETKKSDIDVSIIVPIYNTEDYLPQCLGSLISQTMPNIEIICVDDCSPDNSYKIVEEYQQYDQRIKLFRLAKNVGLGAARNFGLKHAAGNAIIFVDSDDWVMPGLCEEVYKNMLKTQSDVVVFNYFNCHKDKQEVARGIDYDRLNSADFSREELLKYCAVWFKMYANDFINNNGIKYPEGVLYEDWFWSMQWVAQVNNISALNKPYYCYRQSREGSIVTSGKRSKILDDIIKNIDMSISFLENGDYDTKYVYTFINKMEAQTSRLAEGEEKEQLEKIIFDYLKKLFPVELPPEINSIIREIYNKPYDNTIPDIENSNDNTTSSIETPASNAATAIEDSDNNTSPAIKNPANNVIQDIKSNSLKGIFKNILMKISPAYRVLYRLEPLIADMHANGKKNQGRINQINRNNKLIIKKLEETNYKIEQFNHKVNIDLKQFNNKLDEYNNKLDDNIIKLEKYSNILDENSHRLDHYNNKLYEGNNNLGIFMSEFKNAAGRLDQFCQTADHSAEEIKSLSRHYDNGIDILVKKINSLNSLYSSSLNTLYELQDIIFFEGNSSDEPSDAFLNNLDLSNNEERLKTVKLLGHEVRFSDAASFWCVYKELFINQDYGINYKTNTPRVLDCGAHIGLASIYIKNAYPRAKITAFEPDPQNIELLQYNLASFGFTDVEVVPRAVGDKHDMVNFYRATDMSMGGSVTKRMEKPGRELEQFDVSMCRLRDYIINDKIDFLKLDVEGVEDRIIIDCQDCISNVNYLFIEFHCGDDLNMARIGRILQVLDKAGFMYNITRSDSFRKIYRNKPFNKVLDNCTHLIYAKNKSWM